MLKSFCITSVVFKGLIATTPETVNPLQPEYGPGSTENYRHAEVAFYDGASKADGFWLFEPATPMPDSANVIVFMHGYGAYNPMVYGKWIKHLVAQGNIVIYPRYQRNLVLPLAKNFPEYAAKGIRDALAELQKDGHVRPKSDRMVYIGHSYGGAINANLAVNYKEHKLPKPAAMLLVQPGTGPLNGAKLEDYGGIPSDITLTIVVGSRDYVVGDGFGTLVYNTAINTPKRNLIKHYPDSDGNRMISASHHEVYCCDLDFDNGIRNVTAQRALMVSHLDEVDFNCYWKFGDAILEHTYGGSCEEFFHGNTPQQRDMGYWANGKPVRPLEVYVPEDESVMILKKSVARKED